MRIAVRIPVILLSTAFATACADDPTAIREGTYLSSAQQVAIEYALARVADTLDIRGATPTDSVIADFARVTGRLVRLEGRVQTVRVSVPDGGTLSMQAAALWTSGAFAGSAVESQVVIAWEGLDTEAVSVQRALLLVGAGGATGSFNLAAASPSNAARLVDVTSGAAIIWKNTDGIFTVAGSEFRGGCTGLGSSGGSSCTVGRETVSLDAGLSRGAAAGRATFPATVLPAFHLVTQ